MAGMGAPKAPNDLIELGKIVAAYGVKGWIKVQPHSASSDVLRKAHTWWLLAPVAPANKSSDSNKSYPYYLEKRVVTARSQGSNMVAQISELDDRDQAEALAGFTVHVSRSLFPPAKKDEFYWIDLEGCAVYSSNDSAQVGGHEVYVGDVTEVLDNGAHAILRVQRRSAIEPHENLLDSKGRAIEMLIPFVATHVQQVDIPARKIVTDWPLDF